jgi:hypothetical protein
MDWKQMFEAGAAGDPRFARLSQRVVAPSWPLRLGLLSAAVVVALPLAVVVLGGLAVGLLVYFVARLVEGVGQSLGGGGGSVEAGPTRADDPMRENVRVIQRP